MLSILGGSRKRKASHVGSDALHAQEQKLKRQRLAAENRKQKRDADEATRRSYLERNDERNNSSRQSPLLSHLHNQRMQTGLELQALPVSILARIFVFANLIQSEPIALPMSRNFIENNNMALLFVSYRLHQLALRLFWSANDFSIRIENFNARAILPWWTHVSAVRESVQAKPIFVADPRCNKFIDTDFEPVWDALDPAYNPCDNDLDIRNNPEYYFTLRRTNKPWSVTCLAQGTITLDVPYDPHWSNLKEWLHLFHQGEVPALRSNDIGSGQQEWNDLHQIVGLFLSVQREEAGSWKNVEKSLEGWQYTLKFADFRWQFEDGEIRASSIEDADGKLDDDDAEDEEDIPEGDPTGSEEGHVDAPPHQDESLDEYGGQDSEDLLQQLTNDLNTGEAPTGEVGCGSTQTLQSSPPSRVARGRYDYFSSADSESDEEDLMQVVKPKGHTSSPEL